MHPSTNFIERELREALADETQIDFAYLFGSFAKGGARAASDVDVAVRFASGSSAGQAEAAERALDLEGRLEARLARRVQVVDLDLASPELVQNVLGHGTLLCVGDDAARVRFYVDAGRRLYDRSHARAIFERYRERRIRRGEFGGRSRDG